MFQLVSILITRGLRANELGKNKNWWTGPEYLRFPEEEWPVNKGCKPSGFVVKEMRKKYTGCNDGTSLIYHVIKQSGDLIQNIIQVGPDF